MANLVIPRREIWAKQPPVSTEPDWSNPLTSGLISAVLPSAKLFAGTSPSSGGFTATNHLVTEHGIALGRNGGAWSLAQRPIFGITTTSDMTMLAFMYGDSTVLTESNPVTTGQSAAAISSSICVGDGTTKALRYRIYLGAARYVGGSSVIPKKPTVVIGRQRYGIEQALFVGGEKDPVTGSYTGAISGATHFGCYNGNASTRVLLSAIWARALSDEEIRSISANPWQIFAPRETRLFVPVGGGGSVNANASGALSAVSVAAPSASASGGASASGSLAAISISSPTATASAGGSASASGSFASLSISPATATATATKSATASGAFATISLSAPTATASGTSAGNAIASGAPAQITISQATAIAIGSAVATGGLQSIGITAPSATASVGNGNATATGAWAAVSITAPTGYASSGFIRAPSGIGPTVIQPGSIRPRQSATSRPSNTGGRRY